MIYKNVNGTQKLVTNIRKPKKWRRFEYLQSSGTLWIDTGINPRVKPRVIAVLAMLNNADKDYWGNKSINGSAYYANFSAYKLTYYRYGSTTSQNVNYTVTQNSIHEWDVSNKVYVDGVLKFTSANTYTYNASQSTIQIFKAARSSYYSTYRLYSFKLYDGDTLVRDFVPAQYNGEYGLWDLIQNKFYGNKGTGTFTVGPEVGKPYEEIEKLIIPNTLLPSGVELYDYIESTGTQWIDTGVYGYMDHTYEIDFQQTTTGNYRTWGVFGQSSYVGYNMSFTYKSGWILRWNNTSNGQSYTSVAAIDTNRHTLKILNGTVYFDGTNKGTSAGHNTNFNINYNLYLFTINPANTTPTTNNKVKIFSYKDIDANGVLVRNMLPCTYFGEPGMWDTVTKLFYRNQGTGRFILGNKIVLKEYEYLKGDGNAYIDTQYYPNVNTKLILKRSNPETGNINDGEINGSSAYGNNFYIGETLYAFDTSKLNMSSMRNTTPYVVKIDINGLYINDIFIAKLTDYGLNWVSPRSFYLFGLNRGSSYALNCNIIYYCLLYDNGILVRDFVPCTCNETPGLWDKVELKFYGNSGSGTFDLGRLVSGEIPVWVLKNALTKSSSNGTYDYIDTGVNNYTMNNIRCMCEMTPLNDEDTAFFGSRGSYYLFYKVSDNYFWPTSKCETIQGTLVVGHKYLVDWNKGTLTVTGEDGVYEQGVRSSTTVNTGNLYIFTFNPKDSRTAEAKIHWFKIYIDDVLVRDFVPATMGGRPGLYDKVNHKMYFNANSSGNFTVE